MAEVHTQKVMTIELSRGEVALVSQDDYDRVSVNKWYAHKSKWHKLYAARTLKKPKKLIYMHRFLLNAPPGKLVDHINGNGLDNRRENIRICNYSLNAHNVDTEPVSGYRGVCRDGNRWSARITINGKIIFIGSYIHPQEAAIAYDMKARRLFGELAKTNFEIRETPHV